MNTASIKKGLHQLETKDLWEIVAYAQTLLRRSQLSEEEELAFLEEEYKATQDFQLSDSELTEIHRRRTALITGTDKGLTHSELMRNLKHN